MAMTGGDDGTAEDTVVGERRERRDKEDRGRGAQTYTH